MPPNPDADANDWRTLYLRQARADYAVFKVLLATPNMPLCQKLHYLQMATEKLAKGLMTAPGAGEYGHTHDALVRFMQVARTRAEVRQVCRYSNARAFSLYVESLLPVAQQIENLSPEGIPHPNPEYPWVDGAGQLVSPLDYSFDGLRIGKDLLVNKLMVFIEACLTLD